MSKSKSVYFIILFTICISCFAQKRLPKLEAYISFLENKTLQQQQNAINNVSDSQIKQFCKTMFEATEEDPIAVHNYLIKKSDDIEIQWKKGVTQSVKPGFIESELLKKVKSNISDLIYGLTVVPYFLEIKVVNSNVIFPKKDDPLQATKTVINGIVQNIIKGKSRFSKGDTIEFYFYNFWHKTNNEFVYGNNYFVPLEIRGNEIYSKNDPLALVPYLNDSNGYFPIIDEELIDSFNFFEFGIKVPRKIFLEKLEQQIQSIKSW